MIKCKLSLKIRLLQFFRPSGIIFWQAMKYFLHSVTPHSSSDMEVRSVWRCRSVYDIAAAFAAYKRTLPRQCSAFKARILVLHRYAASVIETCSVWPSPKLPCLIILLYLRPIEHVSVWVIGISAPLVMIHLLDQRCRMSAFRADISVQGQMSALSAFRKKSQRTSACYSCYALKTNYIFNC